MCRVKYIYKLELESNVKTLSNAKYLSLIIGLYLSCTNSYAAKKVAWPDSIKSDTAKDMAIGIVESRADEGKPFTPEHVGDTFVDLADDLYAGGIAKLKHYDFFECKVEELKLINKIKVDHGVPTRCYKNFVNYHNSTCKKDFKFSDIYPVKDSDKDKFHKKYKCDGKVNAMSSDRNWFKIFPKDSEKQKNFWKTIYAEVIQDFFDIVKNDRQVFAEEYELSTVRQCESGLFSLYHVNFKPDADKCTLESKACTTHSDCCSEYCGGIEGEKKCAQPKGCYRLLDRDEECGELDDGMINPYCNPGNIRADGSIDTNVNMEKKIQCTQVNLNTSDINECTVFGMKPSDDKPCCSTKTGAGGKCVNKLTCSKCAKGGQKPTTEEACCPGYYKSLSGVCIQDFPPLMLDTSVNLNLKNKNIEKSKNILEKIINFIIPSAHADGCIPGLTCSNGLTPEQASARTATNRACISPNSDGVSPTQEQITACLKDADAAFHLAMNENLKNGVEGAGEVWDAEKWKNQFNMPAITAKTKSDFDSCSFNSFNDSWIDAEADTSNAEIVIRGFEFLFSGNGTQDFWYNSGKPEDSSPEATEPENIYTRAQRVAQKVREFRTKLIAEYTEINRKMTCKCIVAFGVRKFPEKKSFFDSSCDDVANLEKEDLQTLGNEENASVDDKNLSSKDKKIRDDADIDLGASGLAGEKLLLEFLALRTKAQLNRFDYNAKLEAELETLAKFIRENEWEQSRDHYEFLYNFKIKKTAGWIKVVLIVIVALVVVVLSVVTLGGFAALSAGVLIAIAAAGAVALAGAIALGAQNKNGEEALANYAQAMAQKSINGEGLSRKIEDETTRDWYCKNKICFTKYKDIKRGFVNAYFDSKESDYMKLPGSTTGNICTVHGSSRVCFKNIHTTLYSPQEGTTELRYLLDAKVTEFMPNPSYELESNFVGYNDDKTGSVNEAYWKGVAKLKTTKPSKPIKRKDMDDDILLKESVVDGFLLESGNFSPTKFSEDHIAEVKKAVRQYATCSRMPTENGIQMMTLKDCGAIYLGEGQENSLGFGLLFESDTDAEHFADYVYQHHFHWPSLSANESMGYPTMALSSYFEAIVMNLRILGSEAALKALNNGEAYNLYLTDWLKRLGDYNCAKDADGNFICSEAVMGDGSKNVVFSKKFLSLFRKLIFEGGKLPEGIVDSSGVVSADSGFSQAEADLLLTASKKAFRDAKQKERSDHYKKVVGNTARGKQKIKAQNEWRKNFMQPLRKMPLTVGGKQLGMTDFNGKTSSNTSKAKTKSKASIKQAAYKVPKFDMSQYENSYGTSNNSSGSSNSSMPIKRGLQKENPNSFLLDNALKSKSMYERDDSDSIFKIVSKAYYRNLGLILERNGVKTKTKTKTPGLDFKGTKEDLSKDKKSELKKLLSQ
jgi:hypothetical protein